jgi:Na+/melibiose symporter-like transporter
MGLLIGKIWDAVTDPAMGCISDRTRCVLGRRRPYFLIAAVPLGISFFMLWHPISPTHRFANFVIAHMALYTMLTLFLVPYGSLSAGLSPDYDERTRIQGYRESAHIIGLLIGALFPLLVNRFDSARTGYAVLAAIFGTAMTIGVFITFFGVRESPSFQRHPRTGGWRGIKLVASNRYFLRLLTTFILASSAGIMPGNLVPFALRYWLKAGEQNFTFVLLAYLGTAICAMPFWVRLASRIGKERAYFTAFLWSSVALAAVFFLRPGSFIPLAIVFSFAGAAYGAHWMLPVSILADIIDYDELRSGERREGAYFGIWTFVLKLTVAGGAAIVGVVLRKIGFVPDQQQSAHTIFWMRVLMAWIPSALYVVAALSLLRFPFTRDTYRKVQDMLRERAADAA